MKKHAQDLDKVLRGLGYKEVSRGYFSNPIFMNNDFETVCLNGAPLDLDDILNILNTEESEIKKRIEAKNKTAVPYTDDEMENKMNLEDEDLKAVLRDLIHEINKELNG